MPRFRAAKTHPLHTNVMQQTLNVECVRSIGIDNWQIGQSSSSDLVRPFFISTSWFPEATHSSHLLLLCLRTHCSLLYAASGSSRSHAPQILVDEKGEFDACIIVATAMSVFWGSDRSPLFFTTSQLSRVVFPFVWKEPPGEGGALQLHSNLDFWLRF